MDRALDAPGLPLVGLATVHELDVAQAVVYHFDVRQRLAHHEGDATSGPSIARVVCPS